MKKIDELIPERDLQEELQIMIEMRYEKCVGLLENAKLWNNDSLIELWQREADNLIEIYRRLYAKDIRD